MKKIHPTVRIMPGVRLVGRVEMGENSSAWYNAVLRGDREPITIGKYSNIQDNCVLHSSRGYPLEVGDYVSVGHAAVLHGCKVDNNCLIGMNATLLNDSRIGKNSIVGAGALVTQGKKFPPGSLILGMPARPVKGLEAPDVKEIRQNAIRYAKLALNQEKLL
ncbi:MAG: gamma carbonic anhydrase family protein [Methanobacteriaceae archaeon]|nr:gamma carbonic anhydrase family protein [Methanobacteriaceae archaeon]